MQRKTVSEGTNRGINRGINRTFALRMRTLI